jgi:hypothetical protein
MSETVPHLDRSIAGRVVFLTGVGERHRPRRPRMSLPARARKWR